MNFFAQVTIYSFAIIFVLISNGYSQEFGDWRYSSETDVFTDQKSSGILPSVRGIAKFYKEPDTELSIPYLDCHYYHSPTMHLGLLNSFLFGDLNKRVLVELRVDKNLLYKSHWKLLNSGTTSIVTPESQEHRKSKRIVKEMIAGRILNIRVTDPLTERKITSKVSLIGFTRAVSKLPCFKNMD